MEAYEKPFKSVFCTSISHTLTQSPWNCDWIGKTGFPLTTFIQCIVFIHEQSDLTLCESFNHPVSDRSQTYWCLFPTTNAPEGLLLLLHLFFYNCITGLMSKSHYLEMKMSRVQCGASSSVEWHPHVEKTEVVCWYGQTLHFQHEERVFPFCWKNNWNRDGACSELQKWSVVQSPHASLGLIRLKFLPLSVKSLRQIGELNE